MYRKRLLPETTEVVQKRQKSNDESGTSVMNPIDLSRKKSNEVITLSDDEEQEIQMLAAKGDAAKDATLLKEQNTMIRRLRENLRNEECKLILLKSMRHSQRANTGHSQMKDAAANAASAAAAAAVRGNSGSTTASGAAARGGTTRPSEQTVKPSQQLPSRTPAAAVGAASGGSSKSGSSSASNKSAQPQISQAQLDAQKAQKKLALRKQLEKSLLEIPNPQPPPSELNFIPSTVTNEFIALVGLEEVVRNIGEYDQLMSGGKPAEVKYVFTPFSCVQCGTDYTPVWKRDKPNSENVICEQCVSTNQKHSIRKEHTARLKAAFVKALKQEEEIEKEFKRYASNPQLAAQTFPHLVPTPAPQPPSNQSASLATQRSASSSSLNSRLPSSASVQSSQAAAVAAAEQLQRQQAQMLQAHLQALSRGYPSAATTARTNTAGSYPYSIPANYINMLQQLMQQSNPLNSSALWSVLNPATQPGAKK